MMRRSAGGVIGMKRRFVSVETQDVLADDHPVVRRGLRMLLEAEADFEVVAEAGDVGRRPVRFLATSPPCSCST